MVESCRARVMQKRRQAANAILKQLACSPSTKTRPEGTASCGPRTTMDVPRSQLLRALQIFMAGMWFLPERAVRIVDRKTVRQIVQRIADMKTATTVP